MVGARKLQGVGLADLLQRSAVVPLHFELKLHKMFKLGTSSSIHLYLPLMIPALLTRSNNNPSVTPADRISFQDPGRYDGERWGRRLLGTVSSPSTSMSSRRDSMARL